MYLQHDNHRMKGVRVALRLCSCAFLKPRIYAHARTHAQVFPYPIHNPSSSLQAAKATHPKPYPFHPLFLPNLTLPNPTHPNSIPPSTNATHLASRKGNPPALGPTTPASPTSSILPRLCSICSPRPLMLPAAVVALHVANVRNNQTCLQQVKVGGG